MYVNLGGGFQKACMSGTGEFPSPSSHATYIRTHWPHSSVHTTACVLVWLTIPGFEPCNHIQNLVSTALWVAPRPCFIVKTQSYLTFGNGKPMGRTQLVFTLRLRSTTEAFHPHQHSYVTHEPVEPPLGSQVLKTTPTISILPVSHHAVRPIPHLVPRLRPHQPPLITSTCIDMLQNPC